MKEGFAPFSRRDVTMFFACRGPMTAFSDTIGPSQGEIGFPTECCRSLIGSSYVLV